MGTYVFDNAHHRAWERLTSLEAVLDPGTFRVLDALGVRPGCRCLEVGAGAGSVAAWLADRVGPTGRVLATDLDPRSLAPRAAGRPNLEIRRHDVAADDLPAAAFDLIHARLVLEHVPEHERALRQLAAALAPGGWLVIEASDLAAEAADPALDAALAARFARWQATRDRLMVDRGRRHGHARGQARRLRTLGLVDVGTEGRAYTVWGGSEGANVSLLAVEQMREPLLVGGYLTATEIAEIQAMFADPDFTVTTPLILAAWGRHPS